MTSLWLMRVDGLVLRVFLFFTLDSQVSFCLRVTRDAFFSFDREKIECVPVTNNAFTQAKFRHEVSIVYSEWIHDSYRDYKT